MAGDTPVLAGGRGTPSHSWLGYPRTGYPPPGHYWGTPRSGWGTPMRIGFPSPRFFPRSLVPGPFQGYPVSPGWGVPQDRVPPARTLLGYPHSWDRTAERALATRRAVCLLRSRRRTFLSFCNVAFLLRWCYRESEWRRCIGLQL